MFARQIGRALHKADRAHAARGEVTPKEDVFLPRRYTVRMIRLIVLACALLIPAIAPTQSK
jgi:hypothetical protein